MSGCKIDGSQSRVAPTRSAPVADDGAIDLAHLLNGFS